MQLFTSDFLTTEFVLKNLGLFLLAVAIGMPTLFWVRLVALAAGVCAIALTSVIKFEPTVLFWSVIFVIIILLQLRFGRSHKFGRVLSPEEQAFHKQVVPMLSDSQVRLLLTAGRWRDVESGKVLTRQGAPASNLFFVASGKVDIVVDNRRIAECGPGELVGEIGVSTGEVAMATSICSTPVRCLEFEADRLYKLLDGRTELLVAVESAVQESLREKLIKANQRAAHP